MLQRVRPWLGTLVEIRVDAATPALALGALEAGFAAIEDVHRRLSFHERDSELSHLNRDAATRTIAVSPMTAEVLRAALDLAQASDGAFDPTLGARLVDARARPRPEHAPDAHEDASWRDVVIDANDTVTFLRPLWLDLGGIAKGFAVDVALAALLRLGARAGVVNAGGDLAVFGAMEQPIFLRAANDDGRLIELGALRDGAAAGSAVHGESAGTHFDGRDRRPLRESCAVSVIAPRCMAADALTKLMLIDAIAATRLLPRYGAVACVASADGTLHRYGAGA